ncbi:hypothetical protein LEMLEM_LOCUS26252, partial [Lemmus lemmus]
MKIKAHVQEMGWRSATASLLVKPWCLFISKGRQKGCSSMGWRDGSEVKSIACSSKGPEFNSQQQHGG